MGSNRTGPIVARATRPGCEICAGNGPLSDSFQWDGANGHGFVVHLVYDCNGQVVKAIILTSDHLPTPRRGSAAGSDEVFRLMELVANTWMYSGFEVSWRDVSSDDHWFAVMLAPLPTGHPAQGLGLEELRRRVGADYDTIIGLEFQS